jgi:hypothetical protein
MGVNGQRHAPAALCPGERTPGTHCTGGWVDPRTGLNTEARGKISCLCRGSNFDLSVVQSTARHYTAWATPAPIPSTEYTVTLGRERDIKYCKSTFRMRDCGYTCEWSRTSDLPTRRRRGDRVKLPWCVLCGHEAARVSTPVAGLGCLFQYRTKALIFALWVITGAPPPLWFWRGGQAWATRTES